MIRRLLGRRPPGLELRGLFRDSFATAAWQGVASVVDLAQLAMITHTLGLKSYGRLALAIGFVTLLGQFFDVRIGATTMTFGARQMVEAPGHTSRVFRFSYLVDGGTGLLGFLVVVIAAPFVGPSLVGAQGTLLIVLYALTLLLSTVDDTSGGILRLFDRVGLLSRCGMALEFSRLALVATAVYAFHSLVAAVIALVVYDAAGGATLATAAIRTVRRKLPGDSLVAEWSVPPRQQRREMWHMILHTNVLSYARLAQTQLPTIVIGALGGATDAGVYKVGISGAAAVGRLSDPFYASAFPRFSRLWARGDRVEVRKLVEHMTAIAALVMAAALMLIVFLRIPIIHVLGGNRTAATVLVVGAVGQAVNGALFWNTPLLLATGRARWLSTAAVSGAVAQVILLAVLAGPWGAVGGAIAFLAAQLVGNAIATYVGLGALRTPSDTVVEQQLDHA